MVKALALGLWVIVIFHLTAFFNDWYITYRWLDIIPHFFAAFWLAAFFFYLVTKRRLFSVGGGWSLTLFILGMVMLVGVFWEFHEAIADQFIKAQILKMQEGPMDTVYDLFFDFLGASIFLVWQRLFLSKAEKS